MTCGHSLTPVRWQNGYAVLRTKQRLAFSLRVATTEVGPPASDAIPRVLRGLRDGGRSPQRNEAERLVLWGLRDGGRSPQ